MNATWMAIDGRTPKFYHTTAACIQELGTAEHDTESTARGLGMTKCPDCEREERRNATVEPGKPSLAAGG